MDMAVAVEVKGLPDGYRLGAGLQLMSGEAAGRQLYCIGSVGDVFACDGHGEANLQRFNGVKVGDEVHVDNRKFLAFCYFHRHHVMDDAQFDSLRVDGVPIYPQHPVPLHVAADGRALHRPLRGQAAVDPPHPRLVAVAVAGHHLRGRRAAGTRAPEAAAGEVPPAVDRERRARPAGDAAHSPQRASSTWLIDYIPIIEQGLVDLIRWVEDGVPPPTRPTSTSTARSGCPTRPPSAVASSPWCGVPSTAACAPRCKVGRPGHLEVACRSAAGRRARSSRSQWDFDGHGAFPFRHDDVDGTDTAVTLTTTHTYDTPGTYFATALVASHRDGDVDARVPAAAEPGLGAHRRHLVIEPAAAGPTNETDPRGMAS